LQIARHMDSFSCNHFSGPGKAVGPVCVSKQYILNEMISDIDINHADTFWLYTFEGQGYVMTVHSFD